MTERKSLEEFGTRLRRAREAKKLSQAKVGEQLGVVHTTVGAWETRAGRQGPKPPAAVIPAEHRAALAELLDAPWIVDEARALERTYGRARPPAASRSTGSRRTLSVAWVGLVAAIAAAAAVTVTLAATDGSGSSATRTVTVALDSHSPTAVRLQTGDDDAFTLQDPGAYGIFWGFARLRLQRLVPDVDRAKIAVAGSDADDRALAARLLSLRRRIHADYRAVTDAPLYFLMSSALYARTNEVFANLANLEHSLEDIAGSIQGDRANGFRAGDQAAYNRSTRFFEKDLEFLHAAIERVDQILTEVPFVCPRRAACDVNLTVGARLGGEVTVNPWDAFQRKHRPGP